MEFLDDFVAALPQIIPPEHAWAIPVGVAIALLCVVIYMLRTGDDL